MKAQDAEVTRYPAEQVQRDKRHHMPSQKCPLALSVGKVPQQGLKGSSDFMVCFETIG